MVRRERMARWNGRLESSRNGPLRWTGRSVSAGLGEWGFGVIVFGCGEVVGTSTRNEAEERTGCAD